MKKMSLQLHKEIPLKIYDETFKADKNLKIIPKIKSNRVSKLNNFSKLDIINGVNESKSSDKINKTKFLTEKKISKLKYKELYRFNSSSELTNFNTKNNSFRDKSQRNSNHFIQLKIISNNNSSHTDKNANNKSNLKLKLNKMFNKNLINFDDRRKIKKLNKMKILRLYGLYLQRRSQKLNLEDLMPLNITTSNQKFETDEKYFLKNSNNNNYSANNSFSNYSKINTKEEIKEIKKNKRNYTLSELMSLNPYHLVSGQVKYSNPEEMEKISEKLKELNNNEINNNILENKTYFFKNSNLKNNKIGKLINSTYVQLNEKIDYESDFIWRILSMIKRVRGYSPFYISCLLKGYYELWKNYSILLEQLLVKYPIYKWFFEKNNYMKEEVLDEFISCLKIGIKDDKSFSKKLVLLFGENNLINIKKFFLIMELTANNDSFEEKVKFLGELLSDIKLEKEKNCINLVEAFYLINNIFNSSNYRKDIKYFNDILNKEFNDDKKIDKDIYISKNKLIELFLSNKFLQKKIEEFIFKFKNADKIFDEQINLHFNSNLNRLNEIFAGKNYY